MSRNECTVIQQPGIKPSNCITVEVGEYVTLTAWSRSGRMDYQAILPAHAARNLSNALAMAAQEADERRVA